MKVEYGKLSILLKTQYLTSSMIHPELKNVYLCAREERLQKRDEI